MSEHPSEHSEKNDTEKNEKNLITAMKVVQIMQVVSEDLGDKEKKMWRKMLGVESKSENQEEGSM